LSSLPATSVLVIRLEIASHQWPLITSDNRHIGNDTAMMPVRGRAQTHVTGG
jgi:hypothetical protein